LRVFTVAAEPRGAEDHPTWSPDGRRLAFSYNLFDETSDIAVVNSDGTQFDLMTSGHPWFAYPAWSPDGKAIAVSLWRGDAVGVGIMHIGGGIVQVASSELFGKVSWSPDGSLIAYSAGPASARDLMWVKADGTGSGGRIIANGWGPDWRR
jgi:Tol biopolymer transport system component